VYDEALPYRCGSRLRHAAFASALEYPHTGLHDSVLALRYIIRPNVPLSSMNDIPGCCGSEQEMATSLSCPHTVDDWLVY
jgi:hypothetical protein